MAAIYLRWRQNRSSAFMLSLVLFIHNSFISWVSCAPCFAFFKLFPLLTLTFWPFCPSSCMEGLTSVPPQSYLQDFKFILIVKHPFLSCLAVLPVPLILFCLQDLELQNLGLCSVLFSCLLFNNICSRFILNLKKASRDHLTESSQIF